MTALGGREHAGLVFLDGHEDSWPPSATPTGEAADSELGLALGLAAARPPGWRTCCPAWLRVISCAVAPDG